MPYLNLYMSAGLLLPELSTPTFSNIPVLRIFRLKFGRSIFRFKIDSTRARRSGSVKWGGSKFDGMGVYGISFIRNFLALRSISA